MEASDNKSDIESSGIENIDRYLAYCDHIAYTAKTTIINTGDFADTLFYIIKGSATVMVEDGDGREIILAYLSEGQFFGELGMYEENDAVRSACVKARSDCEVGVMTYQRFKELARVYPSLVKALDSQVASRLKSTSKKVLDLAFLDVTGRVASCLLDLCQLPEAREVDDGVQIKVSRQEIARIIGCSREMAGRILKDMQELGLIQAKGMQVVVFGAVKRTPAANNSVENDEDLEE